MNRLNAIIILLLAVVLGSCVSREKCSRYFPPQMVKHDSVTVTVVEKLTDTLFRIDTDSSWLKALIKCDSLGQATISELMSYRNGKRAGVPEIRLKDNVLTAGCKCDSVLIYAMLRQREVTVDRDSKQQITPPPIEVKYIPGWMWFFGITGMLFWAIILIWLLVKYFKKH